MFAVVVMFRVHAGAIPEFLPLVRENAATSLRVEEGCLQFDIATDPDRPEECLLYELYEDKAAFDVHLASDHFRTFDREIADFVCEKAVQTFRNVIQ